MRVMGVFGTAKSVYSVMIALLTLIKLMMGLLLRKMKRYRTLVTQKWS